MGPGLRRIRGSKLNAGGGIRTLTPIGLARPKRLRLPFRHLGHYQYSIFFPVYF